MFLQLQDVNGDNLGQANYSGATILTQWTEWRIDISSFPNREAVRKILLGIGDIGGGSGKMYFDDIIFEPPCTPPVPGDVNNDCKSDFLDFAFVATFWLL